MSRAEALERELRLARLELRPAHRLVLERDGDAERLAVELQRARPVANEHAHDAQATLHALLITSEVRERGAEHHVPDRDAWPRDT